MPQRAYDVLNITYVNGQFDGTEDALSVLFARMGDEVAFYYEIVRERVRALEEWNEVHTQTSELISPTEPANVRDRLIRLIKRGSQIDKLYTGLVQFESEQLFTRSSIREHRKTLYIPGETGFFKAFVDDAIDELPTFPVSQVQQLAAFLESRRSKAVELAVVLAAAVVGGIAGSLVTVLVQNGS